MSTQGDDSKNRELLCYQNLWKITSDFLTVLPTASYENIETFQKQREGLIKVLVHLKAELPVAAISDEVEFQKKALLKSIIEMDTQVLAKLESLKTDTVLKLQSVQEGRKTISAYRSPMEKTADSARLNQKA